MNKEIRQSVQRLNKRLDRPAAAWTRTSGQAMGNKSLLTANVGHLFADHAPIYGGYRLTEISNMGGGQCGFAHNSGTEARMTCAMFKAYLRGIHDALGL